MAVKFFGKEHRVQLGDDFRGINRFQDDSERVPHSRTGNDCRVTVFGATLSLSSLLRLSLLAALPLKE